MGKQPWGHMELQALKTHLTRQASSPASSNQATLAKCCNSSEPHEKGRKILLVEDDWSS